MNFGHASIVPRFAMENVCSSVPFNAMLSAAAVHWSNSIRFAHHGFAATICMSHVKPLFPNAVGSTGIAVSGCFANMTCAHRHPENGVCRAHHPGVSFGQESHQFDSIARYCNSEQLKPNVTPTLMILFRMLVRS